MSQELVKKQKVIVTFDGDKIFYDEDKHDLIVASLEKSKFINVGGEIVAVSSIKRIKNADKQDEIPKGYYKCRYGMLHAVGETCGHISYN